MWINDEDADKRIASSKISSISRGALLDLRTSGLAVISANAPADICDEILAEFKGFCESHPEHANFMDEHGLHDRLANLPIYSVAAQKLALNKVVLEIVETAFEAQADLVGSLYFERGSGQNIHRDTPAFYTIPINHYFGVWHALEDIHPDSGMLTYYEGGHLLKPDIDYVGSGKVDAYFSEIESACIEAGLPKKQFQAKKGDTVIWHPQLPHGGSPIADSTKSRRSIVYHYKPTGFPIYGVEAFFGDQRKLSAKDHMRYRSLGARKYVEHVEPKFFHNKKEGNFKDQLMK